MARESEFGGMNRAPGRSSVRQVAGGLARLGLAAAGLVSLLQWMEADAPYHEEIARHAVSGRSLVGYLAWLVVYAAGGECLLRWGQRRANRRGLWAGRLLGAAVGMLVHARYGVVQAGYGGLLGLAAARAYEVIGRTWVMALWHLLWDGAAVLVSLGIALAGPGEGQARLLYHYKERQIGAGLLVHHPRWSWIDLAHASPRAVRELEQTLDRAGGGPLRVTIGFGDAWGRHHRIALSLQLREAPRSPGERWAIACGALLALGVAAEHTQETLPWWRGTRLSAWQEEDLRSALWGCLAQDPARPPEPPGLDHDRARLLARWRDEGRARVLRQARTIERPALTPAERESLRRIMGAWPRWRVIHSETPPTAQGVF